MSLDLDEILARSGRVADEIVAPNAEVWDRDATWPGEALRALQAVRLGGLCVPTRHGGLGHGLASLVEVCERLGRADGSVALCFGMHHVGVACVAARATAEQAEAWLRPIAEGRHLTTLALSEAGTGAHFWLPETRMERDDGSFRLRGAKSFVTNGGQADSYVVSTVAAEAGAPPGHFSLVLVPRDAPGMAWGKPWEGWGMRGNSARDVTLDEVVVPRANLLGSEGEQIWYVFHVVAPWFLAAMTGTYLGIATHALDECVAHLGARTYTHSGTPVAHVGVVQHELGRTWSKLQRTRELAREAARMADRGDPGALLALCAAKAEVGHAAVDIVNASMTLVGGRGYKAAGPLARCLRDARAAHVMSPTTDLLYTWIGRALLDVPLLGD